MVGIYGDRWDLKRGEPFKATGVIQKKKYLLAILQLAFGTANKKNIFKITRKGCTII